MQLRKLYLMIKNNSFYMNQQKRQFQAAVKVYKQCLTQIFNEKSKAKSNRRGQRRLKGMTIEPDHKFYISLYGKKKYYSDKGNQKIAEAHRKKEEVVYLDNEDINLQIVSHVYYQKERTILHIQSGQSYKVQIRGDSTFIFLDDGQEVRLPDREKKIILGSPHENEIRISLGFYKIDLKGMFQINRFSGFKRKLQVETTLNKQPYQFKNSSSQGLSHKLKNIEKMNLPLIEYIKSSCKQYEVEVSFHEKQGEIKLWGINQKYVSKLVKSIESLISTSYTKSQIGDSEIEYPLFWEKQENPIQIFKIAPTTEQFMILQEAFAAGKITELIRIQNQHIFKKYSDEKKFLQGLNNQSPIKELMLFHGTSETDPKIIYQDHEQSFNINYASSNSLMGKGLYFAEKSEYSINYSYIEKIKQDRIYSMFYCMVAVGESQNIQPNDKDRKDTDYKDFKNKIRYQSTTAVLKGSKIYVVYKNRRAYPLYLIKYKP